ncbi:MAG: Unknown protein [uncultured Sulfurovum sp.]|uniref:Outer membrane protein beta-barrel domain-containing protein n=1 Tax=uncultured Sulfurovum sp. TaxID=269237 RepID=A0A6S6T782_9BACT|nr:MAG: Unknown protein [uncultured Sulfurovum sp.]
MKKIKISLVTLVAVGSILQAGGDFSVVTPYEIEDVMMAEEAYIEPISEPYIEPVPPPPVPEPLVVMPIPVPVPIKDINPSGFYAGLGISAARYKSNCTTTPTGCGPGSTDKTAGVMARVGYDFNQYVGIEARGIRTNWKSHGGKIKHAGLFVKPMLPVSDATNVYGLMGVAKTSTEGRLQKTDAEALALGLGVEVDLSKDTPKEGRYGRAFDGKGNQEKGLGVFADYERMVVKSGSPDLDALSAGVTYDF